MEMDFASELMNTRVFKNKNDLISYLLLKKLKESDSPLGSWTLQPYLQECGIDCGTATVGRCLIMLDTQELTVRKSNRGRVITPTGNSWLERTEAKLARARNGNKLTVAVQVKHVDELVDLLSTRKILEQEAARKAALVASEEDLKYLKTALDTHTKVVNDNQDPTDPALDFHIAVARCSHNKFIIALLETLIYEEKRIEAGFVNLRTRELGHFYVKTHEEIFQAIQKHDADMAHKLMGEHMDKLISDASYGL